MEGVGKSNQSCDVDGKELDQLVEHLEHHEGKYPDGRKSPD